MAWYSKAFIEQKMETARAEALGRAARRGLRERCGPSLTAYLSNSSEGIGTIHEQLWTALECIDALEDRVRDLEKSKA